MAQGRTTSAARTAGRRRQERERGTHVKVKSIKPAGKADVYNMEVETTHSFVVQNGVVAHNCYDETRYFLMSRPIAPTTPKTKPVKAWNPLED